MKRQNIIKYGMITVCLAGAGLALLSGCGSDTTSQESLSEQIAEAGSWTDGTYTTTAEGHNGEFEVTVVIENGGMVEISVGANEEDEDVGGEAILQIPSQMLSAQSYNVDVVSGATETSEALIDAVADCLVQASE